MVRLLIYWICVIINVWYIVNVKIVNLVYNIFIDVFGYIIFLSIYMVI